MFEKKYVWRLKQKKIYKKTNKNKSTLIYILGMNIFYIWNDFIHFALTAILFFLQYLQHKIEFLKNNNNIFNWLAVFAFSELFY